MVVFEYFYGKMDIFGPKMDEMAARINPEMEDMEEVCLSVCLSVIYLPMSWHLVYKSLPVTKPYPPSALNHFLRNFHPRPPSLTPSLARSSWPSVSATMPDCRTERTMKRE